MKYHDGHHELPTSYTQYRSYTLGNPSSFHRSKAATGLERLVRMLLREGAIPPLGAEHREVKGSTDQWIFICTRTVSVHIHRYVIYIHISVVSYVYVCEQSDICVYVMYTV